MTVSAARAPVAYAQVQKMELSYQCGEVVAPALLGDAVTHTLTELGYAIGPLWWARAARPLS